MKRYTIRQLVGLCALACLDTSAIADTLLEQGSNEPVTAGYAPATLMDTHATGMPKGVAVDTVTTYDTDKFRRTSVRAGAMANYQSSHDFTAIGVSQDRFSQGDWSTNVESLIVAYRNVNRATAEGVSARVGLAFADSRTELHGEGNWNVRFTPNTGAELVVNRDAIEAVKALRDGVMANFYAVSVDHAFSERFTGIVMPTYRTFSDGNEQVGARGWLIYSVLPEQGLSLNLKAKAYESSQNGNGAYFSPDQYQRAEIGLRLRRAIGDWRIFGVAGVGREKINHDTEKPTTELSFTGQRSFAGNSSVGGQFAYYRASDSSSNADSGGHYAWRMARVFFTIPFE